MFRKLSKPLSLGLLITFLSLIFFGKYKILTHEINLFVVGVLEGVDNSLVKIIEYVYCFIVTLSFKRADSCIYFINQNMKIHFQFDLSLFFFVFLVVSWVFMSHFSFTRNKIWSRLVEMGGVGSSDLGTVWINYRFEFVSENWFWYFLEFTERHFSSALSFRKNRNWFLFIFNRIKPAI